MVGGWVDRQVCVSATRRGAVFSNEFATVARFSTRSVPSDFLEEKHPQTRSGPAFLRVIIGSAGLASRNETPSLAHAGCNSLTLKDRGRKERTKILS